MRAAQISTKKAYAQVIETSKTGLISSLDGAASESIAGIQSAQLKEQLQ